MQSGLLEAQSPHSEALAGNQAELGLGRRPILVLQSKEGWAMRSGRECKDFVDITAQAIKETPKAWLLNDGMTSKWVPKKLVKYIDKADSVYDVYRMPQWLALQRGFM